MTEIDNGAGGEARPAPIVRAFDRGLDVLLSFGESDPALTVTEVAGKSGLDRKTARRLLRALESLGYVAVEDGRYRLTARTLDLGFAPLAASSFAELAQVYLDDLARDIRQSCSLAIFDGQAALFIARSEVRRVMTISLTPGTRVPAHASAMGRVLLAGFSAEALEQYLETTALVPYTERTIIDPAQLRREIDRVRRDGWAILDQELETGVRSIAAPVRDYADRVIAAVSVGTRTQLVERQTLLDDVLPALRNTVSAIGRDLAGQPAVITGTDGGTPLFLGL